MEYQRPILFTQAERMSNDKVQMSSQILSPKSHAEPCAELDSVLFQHLIKSKSYQTLKSLDPELNSGPGDIHLIFACLPCLPQAGAGRDFEFFI